MKGHSNMTTELGGLQGYSSPNVRHVVFCADAGREDELRARLARLEPASQSRHDEVKWDIASMLPKGDITRPMAERSEAAIIVVEPEDGTEVAPPAKSMLARPGGVPGGGD